MYNGASEKYHVSSMIQDFVFLCWKKGSISLQVYNNTYYHNRG